ncbi:TonB-dependent receptor family protein [Marinicella sp. W31]|uniref:TonB-dependent receptor family protein n=1 Tax=Marinicella sp. W31 TaxID=3023713 RepID=UPI003756B36C
MTLPVWVLCTGQLTAQEQQVEIEPMVVTSETLEEDNAIGRDNTAITTLDGAASIENSNAWRQRRATNLKDMLDFVPGVFTTQRNGAESVRISVRGSGLGRQFQGGGLMLLQDDIPINTADGAFDFQAVDPWLTDYTEIYRGASGLFLGGSTLGGVVNMKTLPPSELDYRYQLRVSAGSYDTRQGLLSVADADDSHSYRISASHFAQQGFREQNKQRSNRLQADYGFNRGATEHRLSLFHLNTYAELPSSLSKTLLQNDPRQSRRFNIIGNFHRDLELSRLAYHFRHQHSGQQITEASVYYFERRLDNPVFTYINRDSDDAGFRFSWNNGDNLSLGVFGQFGEQDERRRENERGLPGAERLYREQQASTTTAFIQYRHQANQKLAFMATLQGVYAERDIDEFFPQRIISKRNYSQLNPRLGLIYDLHENSQIFANLSHSFEPPTFAELNNGNQPGINTPIRAQSADTLEIGTRGQKGVWQWDVAAYYSQVDNEFIRFRFPNGNTRTTNADNSTRLGLEMGLQWQLANNFFSTDDQLSLRTSYQWTDFSLDDDPVNGNNQIPGAPEHYIRTELMYEHVSGWSVRPHVEWIPSDYYIDLANSFEADNYALLGISVGWQPSERWRFYVEGRNLTDRTYISATLPIPDAGSQDGNYFYSGEGRSVYSGLQVMFK